jgi:drug/metabolite transporter (DMT)-like permease
MAKIGINTGIGALELCLFRNFINFILSAITVRYYGKNVVGDVPRELRILVFVRSIAGLFSFTCMILSLQYLPIFISQIVFNTAPFWTAVLGFLILGTKVSSYDLMCMVGCFSGVIMLVSVKKDAVIMEEERTDDNSISHNMINKNVSKIEYLIGLSCILTTAFMYSFIGVITRRLREIHFSLMMFHYGWITSLILIIYLLFQPI